MVLVVETVLVKSSSVKIDVVTVLILRLVKVTMLCPLLVPSVAVLLTIVLVINNVVLVGLSSV